MILPRLVSSAVMSWSSVAAVVALLLVSKGLSGVQAQGQVWQDSFRLDYTYQRDAPTGPDNWANVDTTSSEWNQLTSQQGQGGPLIGPNECGAGNVRPSPINLFANSICVDNEEMLPRQIADTDCSKDNITYAITPYGLKAYYPNNTACVRPTLQLDNFANPFLLVWMELHTRSEHATDGRRFDAELQLVHTGTGQNAAEMAVISILIEADARADNAEFQQLLDGWQQVSNDETTQCDGTTGRKLRKETEDTRDKNGPANLFEPNDLEKATLSEQVQGTDQRRKLQASCEPDVFGRGCEPFAPRNKMFPYSLFPTIWYFSYDGSLTSPPCSPIVNWRILDGPMLISRRQYKQLSVLLASSRNESCERDTLVTPSGENFRPLQERNIANSNVRHCRPTNFGFTLFRPDQQ